MHEELHGLSCYATATSLIFVTASTLHLKYFMLCNCYTSSLLCTSRVCLSPSFVLQHGLCTSSLLCTGKHSLLCNRSFFFFDLVIKPPFLLCTGMHLLLCNRSSVRLQQGLIQDALDDARRTVQLAPPSFANVSFQPIKDTTCHFTRKQTFKLLKQCIAPQILVTYILWAKYYALWALVVSTAGTPKHGLSYAKRFAHPCLSHLKTIFNESCHGKLVFFYLVHDQRKERHC